MIVFLEAAVVFLCLIILILISKIWLQQKSADEICNEFTTRLSEDTNTLLDISSRDKHILRLTAEINKQLKKLRKEKLEYEQGNKELKQAVTNISHDLRTPLTAINGYLDLLEEEEKSATVERYLKIISERTEVLKSLTEELFRFSVISATIEETHPEKISLNGVLEESIAGFYAVLRDRGIEPQIDLPEEPVYRVVDKDSLRRVYNNLISNACKYSDGDLSISMTKQGVIRFTNTATELDVVVVQKLFDRFYTVESGKESTGLGLSIAKLLTEHMGGTLDATLEEHKLVITLIL